MPILVPAIDSFARYLDLNEAFPTNVPRQGSHVARGGIGVAHEPHPARVEADREASENPRRKPWPGSTPSCRAATSKPLSTVDSVARSAPGAPWVKLAGAV